MMQQEIQQLQQHRQLHEENISRLAFVLMKACNEISARSESMTGRKRSRTKSEDGGEPFVSVTGFNSTARENLLFFKFECLGVNVRACVRARVCV